VFHITLPNQETLRKCMWDDNVKCDRRGRICAAEVGRKRRSLTTMLSNLGSVEVWGFIRPVLKAGSSGSSMAYLLLYSRLYLF
jgi:hypothetical protein